MKKREDALRDVNVYLNMYEEARDLCAAALGKLARGARPADVRHEVKAYGAHVQLVHDGEHFYDLVNALNSAYNLGIDTSNIKNCYLKMENPISLLKGNKSLADFGMRNGSVINFTE